MLDRVPLSLGEETAWSSCTVRTVELQYVGVVFVLEVVPGQRCVLVGSDGSLLASYCRLASACTLF